MVAVKTGLAPPPMMPQQPMNMLPPPMPVPAINQPMPIQQGAAPVPVNARRRKRFGDSLENMLSRMPMVASDQMGDMNVFTGQMMNRARPPVVRNMRRGGGMNFEPGRGSIYSTYSPPKSTPSKPTVSRASQIVANQIAQAQKDDRPAPVVVVNTPPPDITGSFSDPSSREDYTPTSAELNQQLLDMGAPDKRFDVVPNAIKKIYSGMGDLDAADIFREGSETEKGLYDFSAETAFDSQYPRSSTILPPKTGGIAAIRSRQPFPDELSLQTPFNNTAEAEAAAMAAQEASFTQPSDPLEPFGGQGPIITSPQAIPFTASPDYGEVDGINLGIGDTSLNPPERPVGGGQTGTGTGSGEEEDDRSIIQKLIDDITAVPGNIARDFRMAIDAGFYKNLDEAAYNLSQAKNPDGSSKYTPDQIKAWVAATKISQDRNRRQTQGQSTDDDSPMSTSPVDPCPPGFKLDPVSRICVPIEEAEEEGPSLDLNRTRDDEFSELDDLMKKIVKPVEETDNVRTMQAGGSVGLNRVADNFLAAMGG